MPAEELLKLSINAKFQDKEPIFGDLAFSDGFEPYEVTIEELEEVVSRGWAFSYQFENSVRVSENFIATDVLAADFDGGIDIDEGLNLDIVKKYGSLFYTTASHSIDQHRFRIVFALPRTITDPQEVRFASRALAQRLGSDLSATDAARLYFGSKDCQSEILGSKISDEFLEELIEDGRVAASSQPLSNGKSTGIRSVFQIKPKQSIVLKSGEVAAFEDIKGKRSVHCPFHPDKRASAFVSQGRQGDNFLHCSACQKTWWSQNSLPGRYNFALFDDIIKELKMNPRKKDAKDRVALEHFTDGELELPNTAIIKNEQYLKSSMIPTDPKDPGVTLIKSPKGSGKTTYLASLLKTVTQRYASLEDFEENDDPHSPQPFHSDQKVLLIGHRQALIGELCERLGLNSYLEDEKNSKTTHPAKIKRRYGVCLDSLWRVEDIKYDIVVIDEVEQVLGHFLSDTIGEKRHRLFDVFSRAIRDARHVIALDADLDWATFNTLKMIKSMPLESSMGSKVAAPPCPISVVLNERTTDDRKLSLYANRSHLIEKMKLDILDGKRVFVTSNSKKQIDTLTKAIVDLADESEIPIPLITITSANSKSEDVQDFIKNAKTKILDYKVILSSPSLGTGVDISFPNGAQEIDVVVGLFESMITNHFEIDQQLARVRDPKEVHVWISPRRYNFETTFEVVVDDLLKGDLVGGLHSGLTWIDRQSLADENPFLTMVALITAKNRASQNNLKSNFVSHKEAQGWKIETVAKDEALSVAGLGLMARGKYLNTEENAKNLLSAQILNEAQYKELERRLDFENSPVTEAELQSMRKTAMELFYRRDATRTLVDLDDNGAFRRQIRLYERLQLHAANPKEYLETHVPNDVKALERVKISTIPDQATKAALLHELLSSTPIYRNGIFATDSEYRNADLSAFAKLSLKLKPFFEGQFNLNTQKDIEKKTTQHLGKVLRLIGLDQELMRVRIENGQRVRYYRIRRSDLDRIKRLTEARSKISPWEYLQKRYDFKYTRAERAELDS